MRETILELVQAREGHFRFESGFHSGRWLELDPLFARPSRVRPVVEALAKALAPYQVEAVCGPLVGGAFVAQMTAEALDVDALHAVRTPSPDDGGDTLYRARYRIPRALRARAKGLRVAVVDDVVSAGSSVRATCDDLEACGARPVVVGALLLMGEAAPTFFAERGIPVEAVARTGITMWTPAECPLCAAGIELEDPTKSTGDR